MVHEHRAPQIGRIDPTRTETARRRTIERRQARAFKAAQR